MTKQVTCDISGKLVSLDDGFLVADPISGEWSFVGKGVPEQDPIEYSVRIAELLDTPEGFIDWMAHLSDKTWFEPKKFFGFFSRFREENNLFGNI